MFERMAEHKIGDPPLADDRGEHRHPRLLRRIRERGQRCRHAEFITVAEADALLP